MPRLKKIDRPVGVEIQIPESLHMRLEILLFDPFTLMPKLGSRSELITNFLAEALLGKGQYMPEQYEEIPSRLGDTVSMEEVMDLRKKIKAKEKISLEDLRKVWNFTRQSRTAALAPAKAKKEKAKPLSGEQLKALLPDFNVPGV